MRMLVGSWSVLAPVERRKSALKLVAEKHMEDVWELVCAIRERRDVPRVLLRGGKRSKQEWIRTQERVAASTSNSRECDSQGCDGVSDVMKAGGDGDVGVLVPPSVRDAEVNEGEAGTGAGSGRFGASMDGEEAFCHKDVNGLAIPSKGDRFGALQASAARDMSGVADSSRDRCGALQAVSAREVDGFAVTGEHLLCGVLPASVVRDVNGLRAEVAGLRKDILQMKSLHAGLEAGSSRKTKSDTCYIYVRLSGMGDTPVGKGCLESILKCHILQYVLLRLGLTHAFFQSGDSKGCLT